MNPVDQLLEAARTYARNANALWYQPASSLGDQLAATASAIIALLGVAEPCGFPLPERVGDKIVWPGVFDDELTPEEAQGLAVALLRRAVGG